MSKANRTVNIDVMISGHSFRIACAEREEPAVRKAIEALEERMNKEHESGRFSFDRIPVIVALRIMDDYLRLQQESESKFLEFERCQNRLKTLNKQIDLFLHSMQNTMHSVPKSNHG